jgi:hypothetical protein
MIKLNDVITLITVTFLEISSTINSEEAERSH